MSDIDFLQTATREQLLEWIKNNPHMTYDPLVIHENTETLRDACTLVALTNQLLP